MITSTIPVSPGQADQNCSSTWKNASSKTVVFFLGVLLWHSFGLTTEAQQPVARLAEDVFRQDRIDVSHASPVSRGGARAVRPAVKSQIRQVSHHETIITSDEFAPGQIVSSSPIFESTCGCESVCDCAVGDVRGPSCGLEPGCGIETWTEPGCGAEGCFDGGCDGCCDSYTPGCGCNTCAGGPRGFLDGMFPRLSVPWNRMEFFAGAAGFTGPMNYATVGSGDQRGSGSFGFYEGFNKGIPLGFFGTDLSYQSGVRFLQANLSGADFTDESRKQIFLTNGLFRRVDWGLQYGVVLDYLYEDWYFRGNLIQLRGELSWKTQRCDVFGFKFATGVKDDDGLTSVTNAGGTTISNQVSFDSVNQYRFFYRQMLSEFGSLEGALGWTDDEDFIVNLDLALPVHRNVTWDTSATYYIPDDQAADADYMQEGWNLAFGFTIRPGASKGGRWYSRPLMNVADNGTMIVNRR
ncbi:DUF6666 family protein [Rhodopirellula sp. MGV]|uniref:DUF6666 family protein n=1 Tax=Rhodopirellula sp. MGV TaxID=2023130 RepID=UPI000BCF6169|nr:DUF6666 family protein [Rhodopirellula sp. MGV]OYP31723.1 hypothetical protein CGZ80_20745 [Rhodopirellula sp. MGV]